MHIYRGLLSTTHKLSIGVMKLGWFVPWDVNMCTSYFNMGGFD